VPRKAGANTPSKKYIDAVLSKLPAENLHLGTAIVGVSSTPDGVVLEEESGRKHLYDHVILA
jgi:predicted NAD/FAD-binding protein